MDFILILRERNFCLKYRCFWVKYGLVILIEVYFTYIFIKNYKSECLFYM